MIGEGAEWDLSGGGVNMPLSWITYLATGTRLRSIGEAGEGTEGASMQPVVPPQSCRPLPLLREVVARSSKSSE